MLPDRRSNAPYQVLPDLSVDTIESGERGAIPDGHHLVRAWHELRAEGRPVPDCPRIVRMGLSEDRESACKDWASLDAWQAALRDAQRRRPRRLDGGSVVFRTERR
jgi:hypothetical protein